MTRAGDLSDPPAHTRAAYDWHVNTALLQVILAEPEWASRMTDADRRALTPLFWTHVNLYGRFDLDMDKRLYLDQALAAVTPRDPGATGRGDR